MLCLCFAFALLVKLVPEFLTGLDEHVVDRLVNLIEVGDTFSDVVRRLMESTVRDIQGQKNES